MSDFYVDDNYTLSGRVIAGSKCGILAFCGVGHGLGAIQIDEFSGSFSGKASLVFLKDLKRSWWNNGNFEAILEKAVDYLGVRKSLLLEIVWAEVGHC